MLGSPISAGPRGIHCYRSTGRISPPVIYTLERPVGIEPTSSAWKAVALPLSYGRYTSIIGIKWLSSN